MRTVVEVFFECFIIKDVFAFGDAWSFRVDVDDEPVRERHFRILSDIEKSTRTNICDDGGLLVKSFFNRIIYPMKQRAIVFRGKLPCN
jgi:hypothetical protein